MSVNTFAFVLALAAVVFAAVAWITSWIHAREHALRMNSFEKSAEKQLRDLEKQSPSNLAAEVAALSDAVTRVAITQRKFAGRFDQFAAKGTEPPRKESPDETRARLRAEHGLPTMPRGRNNGE